MTTGHVFLAASLDGFVARQDHQLDWLNKQPTDGDDHGYYDFVEKVDGIIMGRGSYETVLSFGEWPYEKPVIVLSKSISQDSVSPALKDRVRVINQDPHGIMNLVTNEGWSRAYVDGGNLVQSFIAEGLVSDIVLTIVPILIGSGIRLFGDLTADIDLELIESKTFESGLMQAKYRLLLDEGA